MAFEVVLGVILEKKNVLFQLWILTEKHKAYFKKNHWKQENK